MEPPSTTEVPDAIEPYLNDHDVMLLENHGALTVGSDVITAYYRMESLELWAKITINAIILGGSYDIDRKNIDKLIKSPLLLQNYRQAPRLSQI